MNQTLPYKLQGVGGNTGEIRSLPLSPMEGEGRGESMSI